MSGEVRRYNVVHQDSLTCARLIEAVDGPMVTYSAHATALARVTEELDMALRQLAETTENNQVLRIALELERQHVERLMRKPGVIL